MPHLSYRSYAWLLASSALCVPLAALPATALAQDAEVSTEISEIVVTGQREAQRAAIAVKRRQFEVMDAVSSDDIGKLPDHNTAAALRRIPGVSIMEDQGEPRWPVLRGLASTYNRTTIDGAFVGSVDESARTVPMDIVPSVMAGRLEVIKTVTPENDANAIGGVINVRTRSAFDRNGPFLTAWPPMACTSAAAMSAMMTRPIASALPPVAVSGPMMSGVLSSGPRTSNWITTSRRSRSPRLRCANMMPTASR